MQSIVPKSHRIVGSDIKIDALFDIVLVKHKKRNPIYHLLVLC